MDWKQVGITAAITIVVTFILTWLWRDAVWRGSVSDRDTVFTHEVEFVPGYSVSGPPGGASPESGATGKPRSTPAVPLITTPAIKDSADTLNCVTQVLLNTVGRLNAELAQYKDVDSFSEDSLRYTLAVTWDGSKPVNERFWRWLQIKPYPYTDTVQTVTHTIVQPGPKDWIPWAISGVAVVLLILSMLYG